MTPEFIIERLTRAIQHRCVSNSATWYIIYYHNRICCVPTNAKVPPEIILGQFTEDQAHAGFTTKARDGINEYAIHFFKELYK
ncbi:hypothetical protein ES703_106849 [subsurface metagenome]